MTDHEQRVREGFKCNGNCSGHYEALDALIAERDALRGLLETAKARDVSASRIIQERTAERDALREALWAWSAAWDAWQRGADVQSNAGYAPVSDDDLMAACAELRAALAQPTEGQPVPAADLEPNRKETAPRTAQPTEGQERP